MRIPFLPVMLTALTLSWSVVPAVAQPSRPTATLTAAPVAAAAPGATVTLRLGVTLPGDVHVQAHEPSDPLLIPTVATVTPPAGLTAAAVRYPAPEPFTQTGRDEPLLVLGPIFEVDVQVTVARDAAPGRHTVPVVLRYQACNAELCFPPARATASWTLEVTAGR